MEVRFTEKHFSKLRKISGQPMAHVCLPHGPLRSRGRNRDPCGRRWLTARADDQWKQDFAAELWDGRSSGSLTCDLQGQATQDLGTTRGYQSSGVIQTGFGVSWVHYLRRDLKTLQCRQHQPFFRVRDITSGEGQGIPDDKHMALKAKSGRHQLLKVTL